MLIFSKNGRIKYDFLAFLIKKRQEKKCGLQGGGKGNTANYCGVKKKRFDRFCRY